MSEKGMFPCSDPVEPLNPDPPAAIDNLGIRCQGPVLAQILGAKLPPPPPNPKHDPVPRPAARILPSRGGKKFTLGGGRRP
jgi:hypothetical protein